MEELGGPAHMNSLANAQIAIPDLPSQPHELPALAARGVLQYGYNKKKFINQKRKAEEVSVETNDTIAADDYQAIRSHMLQDGSTTPVQPTRRARGRAAGGGSAGGNAAAGSSGGRGNGQNELEEETPDAKVRRETIERRDKSHRSIKTLHDKMLKELSEVRLVEDRLRLKAWGDAALTHLQAHTSAQTKNAEELLNRWMTDKEHFDPSNMSNLELDMVSEELDGIFTKTQTNYKDFNKRILAEFSQLKR